MELSKEEKHKEADKRMKRERYKSDEAYREFKKQQSRERVKARQQAIIDSGGELKTRGRPKKEKSVVPSIDDALLMENKPIIRRGRPKKKEGEPTHPYVRTKPTKGKKPPVGIEKKRRGRRPKKENIIIEQPVVPKRIRRFSI